MEQPSYLPSLVMIALAVTLAATLVLAGTMLGPRRRRAPPEPLVVAPARRLPFEHPAAAVLFITLSVAIVLILPGALALRVSPALAGWLLATAGLFLGQIAAGAVVAWSLGTQR